MLQGGNNRYCTMNTCQRVNIPPGTTGSPSANPSEGCQASELLHGRGKPRLVAQWAVQAECREAKVHGRWVELVHRFQSNPNRSITRGVKFSATTSHDLISSTAFACPSSVAKSMSTLFLPRFVR